MESRRVTEPDLCHTLRRRIPELSVINRLDQPVEGLVLFAKNKAAAKELSFQMQNRTMEKEYLSIVRGAQKEPEGRLEGWIRKDKTANLSRLAKGPEEGAKRAGLAYRVLGVKKIEGEPYSLVKIRLHTGRHHQIRVQFAGTGHPVAGDRKYGTAGQICRFPALCAFRLSFRDPGTKEIVTFTRMPEGELFGVFREYYQSI